MVSYTHKEFSEKLFPSLGIEPATFLILLAGLIIHL
jgi:hypothetical protein